MNGFKDYHPIVNFIYFVAVIGFSMAFMHPICLLISLACGLLYAAVLKGKRTLGVQLAYLLPLMLIAALINPAFNHQGVTILWYFPNGNPLTLESVLYGLSAAGMIAAVIFWFACYHAVMTSDKFIYLFGKVLPSLSLILSMTLRFVPRFFAQLKIVVNAQKCIGRDASNGSFVQRAKHGLTILSILVTWAFENAIETADSMKSRGYGLPGRTAFSIFRFDKRDCGALLMILGLGLYVLVGGGLLKATDFVYFPVMQGADLSVFSYSVFIAYFVLCMLPLWMTFWEVRKWKVIKSNG